MEDQVEVYELCRVCRVCTWRDHDAFESRAEGPKESLESEPVHGWFLSSHGPIVVCLLIGTLRRWSMEQHDPCGEPHVHGPVASAGKQPRN